ncbi:unnamed protein product [Anisakis simplex]|uniref:Stomatin-like protein 1 (inferred by orthology to a human protein) n=1 Tax=Anisakis simplex TaxID=6269 RepID=A0A0M3K4C9_ANISI|nr:unnamed protein product [Anisakis simplex]
MQRVHFATSFNDGHIGASESTTSEQIRAEQKDGREEDEEEDWRLKYKSAFTYADYNDLDNMGYEAPKRYRNQVRVFLIITKNPYYRNQFSLPIAESPSMQTSAIESVFVALSFLIFLLTLPLSLLFSLKFVGDFERLVVLRLGRAQKTRGPGATVILPCIDTCTKVDLRVNAFNVPPMQIITSDRGLVELGATVFLQIKDALAAVCTVRERNQSIRTLAITSLYRIVSKRRVCEIISGQSRTQIAGILQEEMSAFTVSWGVQITKIEISEVKVIKEGENMAISTFKSVVLSKNFATRHKLYRLKETGRLVMHFRNFGNFQLIKSEFGNEVLQTINTTVQEFISEHKTSENDLIDFNSNNIDNKNENHNNNNIDINKNVKKGDIPSTDGMPSNETPKLSLTEIDDLLGTISMVIDERLVALVGYAFQVECEDVGDFYLDLKNGSGCCNRGRYANADVTFQLNRSLFEDIVKKRISPMHAYMCGSLKLQGSIQAAMKLTFLADRVSELL